MRAVDTPALMRGMVGLAAFIQAIDTAIVLTAVFDGNKMQLPFFDWLPVIPLPLLPLYIGIWCLAAVSFAAGRHIHIAGVILMLAMSYAILVDQQSYSNHVHLLILVVLLLMLPRRYSDVLLRWQMSIVYFFAAISKVNLIYISGVIVAGNLRNGWIVQLPESLIRLEIMLPLAIASICLELFLAIAFWTPRYRPAALVVGTVFHISIVLLFPANVILQLIVFGLTMGSLYLLFLDPAVVAERVQSAIDRARRGITAPARS